jgi:hypothetical protein
MASITNVGGITSLTDQAIGRLKYRDDSSGTPFNKELGHGYQQPICCGGGGGGGGREDNDNKEED